MLNNIKTYGFNSDASINGGLGGLWVNWRYGTNPLQTNVNGTGETDEASGKSLRHDPLTDLRYLHDLWLYKAQNPSDNGFEGEITRYSPIVKYEFKNSHNERGWLYDEFIDLYNLSHDSFYKDTASSLATGFAKGFNSGVGSIYKTNSSGHAQGSYRVDLTLESGCALVQAGTLFNNPQWTQEGLSTIKFVYEHAYIQQYHIFPDQVDNVLNVDGSVNNQEQFFSGQSNADSGSYAIKGGQTQLGSISQIIISLLDTYRVTHSQDFLSKATDLLDSLSAPRNPLGLWDNNNGGYYFAAIYSGSSPTQPGSISVVRTKKEAGRQSIMLQAFHMANKVTNDKYKDMESRMLDVALKHIYVPAVHGVLYLVNPDWSTQTFKNGTPNNMVTTEATGAELESLFSLKS
ncbi:MAG: hypothetical protein PVSMB5_02450 [Ktedonobacteraceae bacterium]